MYVRFMYTGGISKKLGMFEERNTKLDMDSCIFQKRSYL